MRVATAIVMLGCVFPIQSCAECLPFSEAPKNIGASKCTTGKVLKVTCGVSGTYFLNFCPDYRGCPLSGRGVPCRLRHVGDIRQLEGKIIEVHEASRSTTAIRKLSSKIHDSCAVRRRVFRRCRKSLTSKTRAAIAPGSWAIPNRVEGKRLSGKPSLSK